MSGRDNFISWSIDEKITFLRGIQEARLTGFVTRISTARGVESEFDPSQRSATQLLQELEYSIAIDRSVSQLDPNGTTRQACQQNLRQFNTRPIFC